MKKIIMAILTVFGSLSLFSCSKEEPESKHKDLPVPTGTFKVNVIDPHNYIYDKRPDAQSYYVPGTEIVLHSYPLTDVDLAMYVDGEFYSIQTSIEKDDGYIWEYRFTMIPKAITLEFEIQGGM